MFINKLPTTQPLMGDESTPTRQKLWLHSLCKTPHLLALFFWGTSPSTQACVHTHACMYTHTHSFSLLQTSAPIYTLSPTGLKQPFSNRFLLQQGSLRNSKMEQRHCLVIKVLLSSSDLAVIPYLL